MIHHPDIDIDFGDREDVIAVIKSIPAAKFNKGKISKHNTGVYIQPIPVNPTNGFANIMFKEADSRGYFKLDLLNVSIYKMIQDQDHYEKLLNTDPPWHRLNEQAFVEKIIHINNYFSTVSEMMPDNIPRMAMFLSAIRPAKRHLLHKPWKEISETIWDAVDDGTYAFKKSHSIAYAVLVTLHMNLINEQDSNPSV